MAFKLKRRETVEKAVSRLVESCVKKAIAEATDGIEAIHTARKQVKKMRAVLRLVRKEIGEKMYARRIDGLRAADHLLAPTRDAYIRLQTFDDIYRRANSTERTSMRSLRIELRRQCDLAVANFSNKNRWINVRAILEHESKCFSKIRFNGEGWSVIEPGLKKSYRATQRARKTVAWDATSPKLHRWRKRVKNLLYNVSLLEPIWPEQMCALKQDIGSLAELLGDHHDLHVLRQMAVKKAVKLEFKGDAETLLPLIDARQQELGSQALGLGARVLHEKPSIFCARLHRYWKKWKRNEQSYRRINQIPAAAGA